MSKVAATVKVNFGSGGVTTDPVDVQVSKSANNAIVWTAQQKGYTFTGITIQDDTGDPGGDKEWDAPVITTIDVPDPSKPAQVPDPITMKVSQMTVTDKFKDTTDHKYTLLYTDPDGNAGSYDPGIKNNG